ncbi:hypothetical protein CkaCkLH20_04166 [Colletotrichum karsti]|uniref:Uncharacterized protein n=1 Tax=Colletotrichum karsti TaxID=1095194 RepID=A0A9P6LLT0_9PEZI|nr:uncharacterized protein CkaCkLH20_04166 [Colletotrichum karsti]KAF9878128.1 hypothetical protein CkaCkLH20_04166 [Colletotrichum karsti]
MKLLSLALLAPFVSAACDTSKNEISLTFMLSNFYDYEVEEFCPVAGSCVNMPAGPDEWSQKADWALMKANTCVRFYKANDCPSGVETWEPPCYDTDWAVFILQSWQDGAIKSYTVFKK